MSTTDSIDDLKQQLQRAQTERTRMAAMAQSAQSAHSQASTQLQIHQSQLTFCKQEIASLKAAVAERDALLSRERQQRGDAAEALASTQRLVEHERSLIQSLKREHEQVISDMKSQQWLKVQNEVALYEEKARLDLAALKARHQEETELLFQKLQAEKRISIQYSENVSEFEQRFRELEMSQREKEATMALQQSQQQQHFADTLATREKQYLTTIETETALSNSLKQQNAALQSEVSHLNAQLTHLYAECDRLRNLHQLADAALAEQRQLRDTESSALKQTQQRLEILEESFDLSTLNANQSMNQSFGGSVVRRLHNRVDLRQSLEDRCVRAEREVRVLKAQLETSCRSIEMLARTSDAAAFHDELFTLRDRCAVLEREASLGRGDTKERLRSALAELSEAQACIVAVTQERDASQATHAAEIVNLSSKLNSLEVESQSRQAEVASLNLKLQQAQNELKVALDAARPITATPRVEADAVKEPATLPSARLRARQLGSPDSMLPPVRNARLQLHLAPALAIAASINSPARDTFLQSPRSPAQHRLLRNSGNTSARVSSSRALPSARMHAGSARGALHVSHSHPSLTALASSSDPLVAPTISRSASPLSGDSSTSGTSSPAESARVQTHLSPVSEQLPHAADLSQDSQESELPAMPVRSTLSFSVAASMQKNESAFEAPLARTREGSASSLQRSSSLIRVPPLSLPAQPQLVLSDKKSRSNARSPLSSPHSDSSDILYSSEWSSFSSDHEHEAEESRRRTKISSGRPSRGSARSTATKPQRMRLSLPIKRAQAIQQQEMQELANEHFVSAEVPEDASDGIGAPLQVEQRSPSPLALVDSEKQQLLVQHQILLQQQALLEQQASTLQVQEQLSRAIGNLMTSPGVVPGGDQEPRTKAERKSSKKGRNNKQSSGHALHRSKTLAALPIYHEVMSPSLPAPPAYAPTSTPTQLQPYQLPRSVSMQPTPMSMNWSSSSPIAASSSIMHETPGPGAAMSPPSRSFVASPAIRARAASRAPLAFAEAASFLSSSIAGLMAMIDGTMKHAHEKLELLDVRLFDSMVNVVKVSAVVDRFQLELPEMRPAPVETPANLSAALLASLTAASISLPNTARVHGATTYRAAMQDKERTDLSARRAVTQISARQTIPSRSPRQQQAEQQLNDQLQLQMQLLSSASVGSPSKPAAAADIPAQLTVFDAIAQRNASQQITFLQQQLNAAREGWKRAEDEARSIAEDSASRRQQQVDVHKAMKELQLIQKDEQFHRVGPAIARRLDDRIAVILRLLRPAEVSQKDRVVSSGVALDEREAAWLRSTLDSQREEISHQADQLNRMWQQNSRTTESARLWLLAQQQKPGLTATQAEQLQQRVAALEQRELNLTKECGKLKAANRDLSNRCLQLASGLGGGSTADTSTTAHSDEETPTNASDTDKCQELEQRCSTLQAQQTALESDCERVVLWLTHTLETCINAIGMQEQVWLSHCTPSQRDFWLQERAAHDAVRALKGVDSDDSDGDTPHSHTELAVKSSSATMQSLVQLASTASVAAKEATSFYVNSALSNSSSPKSSPQAAAPSRDSSNAKIGARLSVNAMSPSKLLQLHASAALPPPSPRTPRNAVAALLSTPVVSPSKSQATTHVQPTIMAPPPAPVNIAQQLASAASAAASSTAVALHAELSAAKESAAESARQVRQLSDELDKLKSARATESEAQQVVLQDWKQNLEQQKAAWVQLRSDRRQGEIALAELRSELDRKSAQLLKCEDILSSVCRHLGLDNIDLIIASVADLQHRCTELENDYQASKTKLAECEAKFTLKLSELVASRADLLHAQQFQADVTQRASKLSEDLHVATEQRDAARAQTMLLEKLYEQQVSLKLHSELLHQSTSSSSRYQAADTVSEFSLTSPQSSSRRDEVDHSVNAEADSRNVALSETQLPEETISVSLSSKPDPFELAVVAQAQGSLTAADEIPATSQQAASLPPLSPPPHSLGLESGLLHSARESGAVDSSGKRSSRWSSHRRTHASAGDDELDETAVSKLRSPRPSKLVAPTVYNTNSPSGTPRGSSAASPRLVSSLWPSRTQTSVAELATRLGAMPSPDTKPNNSKASPRVP